MTEPALKRARELSARITEYLALGGLCNPEMMTPQMAVRDLLMDCREELDKADAWAQEARLEEAKSIRKQFEQTKEPTMISAWMRAYKLIDERIAALEQRTSQVSGSTGAAKDGDAK